MTGEEKLIGIGMVVAALIAALFIKGCTDVLMGSQSISKMEKCLNRGLVWKDDGCSAAPLNR